jgi:hypothetical protein
MRHNARMNSGDVVVEVARVMGGGGYGRRGRRSAREFCRKRGLVEPAGMDCFCFYEAAREIARAFGHPANH